MLRRAVCSPWVGASPLGSVVATAFQRRFNGESFAPPPVAETDESFIARHMNRALDKQRLSPESAAYYTASFKTFQELRPCVALARKQVGTSDPERWTSYQQQQFANIVSEKAGEICALSLQKAKQENESMQQFASEGTPTGENYWLEASETLLSPDVPSEVKAQILEDMQSQRRQDSPAFDLDMDAIPPHLRDLVVGDVERGMARAAPMPAQTYQPNRATRAPPPMPSVNGLNRPLEPGSGRPAADF